jgi:hypothetical protein
MPDQPELNSSRSSANTFPHFLDHEPSCGHGTVFGLCGRYTSRFGSLRVIPDAIFHPSPFRLTVLPLDVHGTRNRV